MKKYMNKRKTRPGAALIIAMIFVVLFSSLALAMMTMSSTNAQTASNHRLSNQALQSAQSGLEMIRYLFEGISIDADIAASGKFEEVYNQLIYAVAAKELTSLPIYHDPSTKKILVSEVVLDSARNQNFSCTMRQSTFDERILIADITGVSGNVDRSIRANFAFDEAVHTVFDFGIATKGPLLMSGQTTVDSINLAVESDVYIESDTLGNAFEIDNKASVGGDVHIVNPYGTYDIGRLSTIGGETGEAAEEHVEVGTDPVDFPAPNVDYFLQFATGDVITSESTISNYEVLNNVTIAANTNPTFASHITINGILFIEQPNNVTFAGQVDVFGVIVGDSEPGESVGLLDFSGQVESFDASNLEGAEFAAISEESGTFIMAPGFIVDFSGQANYLNGTMAVGGARFTGQAGGEITGSIINYSENPVILQGQSELLFNRAHLTEVPSGFEPSLILAYDAATYSEIVL